MSKLTGLSAAFVILMLTGCIHPKTTQKSAILVVDPRCQNLWAERCEIRGGTAKCIGLHLVPKCSRVEQH